ncbi:1,4-alpha-glucan branching protein GlgB [Falsibacillus pallidus]|uniref:1,4-alpha-glucan branching enzyme GlgB n=1 Tax=Falsibacillus pallidus TaxID=493781 RepID=A0A370GPI1_9BACI|nr:1,4-alpha-glucan branching protein GlgB [Falsibacillus pallidus]RDI44384.1 1,4-alpha-glucan branching enzyme [Falsibacillus pallidus]
MEVMNPTENEFHLFHEGKLFQAYHLFGAHVYRIGKEYVTRFCVWSPNAIQVQVIGSFNQWDGSAHVMEREGHECWCLQVPKNLEGHQYKYRILTRRGDRLDKTDPFAFYTELRPGNAGIIYRLNGFQWSDHDWMGNRSLKSSIKVPAAIYEVHLGSWRRNGENGFKSYSELADELIPYVKEHFFTHVELMPLAEHPFDGSWGYQGTGYFAATSRYGSPFDLMNLINRLHAANIGVILDWVPGHFCKDAHGLFQFDGDCVFEYENEKHRENGVWGTANFDLSKREVKSFLISNLHYWMNCFHIDGFRVDAVANILYWPNEEAQFNHCAIEFLREMNGFVHQYDSSVLMIAEDSSDFPGVTASVQDEGLGFSYKWNMGWMNDLLRYMETPPEERKDVHSLITFSLMYAFSEKFILPLSHDEVVHGKKSLLDKCPGNYEDKFAQLRLLFGYLVAHPGKKLLFMGAELASFSEWNEARALDWNLMEYEQHQKTNVFLKQLLHLYQYMPPLFEMDDRQEGFEWIDVNNSDQQIFSFIRHGLNRHDFVTVICNFSGKSYYQYKVGVLEADFYLEILNSDHSDFGGLGRINDGPITSRKGVYHGKPHNIELTIPPYSIIYLKPSIQRKEQDINGKSRLRSNAVSGRKRKSVKLINTNFG